MIEKIFNVIKFSFTEEIFGHINEAYTRALGTGLYLGMFFLAVIFVVLEAKKEEKNRAKLVFGIYSIIVLFLALNPIFANISIAVIGSEVYWRVYWLLPIGLLLAYVFTELIYKMSTKLKKVLASILIIFIIIIGGKWIYTEENFVKINNYYKIPDTALDVILQVSADDEEYKQLAGPLKFQVYTRQVDGNIILSEGRSFSGTYPEDSIVTYIMNSDYANIYKKAVEINCNYVVLNNTSKNPNDDLTNYGFTKFYENIDYTVYKLEENTSWVVTQYGEDEDVQLMCFTIEGNKNGLVIIDGGYDNDEETLKILEEKIKENGNVVNAWILTHFDEDHAGAYMALRNRINNLKVGKLYVPDMPDYKTCVESVNGYENDELELLKECLNINIPEKVYVHSGDVIDNIIGLKMKVLSAYDKWISEEMTNLLNNGSIVFKLYGNEESIMFCGDAQSEKISDYILENYSKEELKSDYLQVAHHGNNSFSDEFYETVNPKVAFFPAPTAIMENVHNISWFSVEENSKLLEEMGATIYSFADSPSQIVMK